MTVRYIRVDPQVNLFAPAVRAFGNIAIVGRVTPPDKGPEPPPFDLHVPIAFTDPRDARNRFPGELGESIALAFRQTPGPTLIYGVPVDKTTPNWSDGLDAVTALNVQLVTRANTPLNPTTTASGGPIPLPADPAAGVSNTRGDATARPGAAMLPNGTTSP